MDFSISLYSRTEFSCMISDCDSSRKSGRLRRGSVGELAAGAYLAVRLEWVRWRSLKRKEACSNFSSIAIRMDSFSFSAVCLLDFISTDAPLRRLMFCSQSFKCSFTLRMRLACAYFSNLEPDRMPGLNKEYTYLGRWVCSREMWDRQGRRWRSW